MTQPAEGRLTAEDVIEACRGVQPVTPQYYPLMRDLLARYRAQEIRDAVEAARLPPFTPMRRELLEQWNAALDRILEGLKDG